MSQPNLRKKMCFRHQNIMLKVNIIADFEWQYEIQNVKTDLRLVYYCNCFIDQLFRCIEFDSYYVRVVRLVENVALFVAQNGIYLAFERSEQKMPSDELYVGGIVGRYWCDVSQIDHRALTLLSVYKWWMTVMRL